MKKIFTMALAAVAMALTLNQAIAAEFVLPNMQVKSNAFEDGGIIPIKFTSHG